MELKEYKVLNRELAYKAAIFDLYNDTLELPDGNQVTFNIIEHKGAAAVVPVLEDGRILLVKQYRPAVGRFTIEIPAGGLNSREEPTIDAAMRELEEETGYRTDHAELLITIHTVAAYSSEKIDIYLAENLTRGEGQHLDEDEFINTCALTVEEICEKIYALEITDAKTISAIMAYKNRKEYTK